MRNIKMETSLDKMTLAENQASLIRKGTIVNQRDEQSFMGIKNLNFGY